jgi:hypothetical protein
LGSSARVSLNEISDTIGPGSENSLGPSGNSYAFYSQKPGRPAAPRPLFGQKSEPSSLKKDQAIALYTFNAIESVDLAFKKGDIITITKRTESQTDWWTGRIGDRTRIFPR